MTEKKILLCLAHMSGNEQQFINEAFRDNWVVPLGPNVDAFEQELQTFYGGDSRVVALSSGTAAIHLALVMLGVGPGDEVICQSFTFCASANPIIYCGATPVFVDSDPSTWNISPELLDRAISERIRLTGRKPKAIIAVDLYGMPADMSEIMAIARSYDIPLVEDAAEAMGSTFGGRQCGTFGDFGAVSFNGNKMITTSGGGALICHDAATAERAKFYATQAREARPYYHHLHVGYNYRMSNICAGIGRGQMTVLEEHIAHHRHLADLYGCLFSDTAGISLHINPSYLYGSNYWLNAITIDPLLTGTDPETVRLHLVKHSIESRPLWKPLHLQPVYSGAPAFVSGVSESLFDRGLCLPSGPWVTDDDACLIAKEIKRCIRK